MKKKRSAPLSRNDAISPLAFSIATLIYHSLPLRYLDRSPLSSSKSLALNFNRTPSTFYPRRAWNKRQVLGARYAWIRRGAAAKLHFGEAVARRKSRGGRKNGTKSGAHLGLALYRQGVFDVGETRRPRPAAYYADPP